VLLAACGIATAAPAQAAAFDRALAEFAAAAPEERLAAAARASDAFLGIASAEDRRSRWVPGISVTWEAGRAALTSELCAEARAAGIDEPTVVRLHLSALARVADLPTFVRHARADAERHGEAVADALTAEEARVVPECAPAARRGHTEAARWVLEFLAAVEPVQGYRLANYALFLRQTGEVERAAAVYERAIVLAPDDLELRNDQGLLLRAMGEIDAARRAFEASHALDLGREEPARGRGPAITNLVHLTILWPEHTRRDPLPAACRALRVRPDATMLARLSLDLSLDRLMR
jgi:tetratricopeptide (TPR) repeat protein